METFIIGAALSATSLGKYERLSATLRISSALCLYYLGTTFAVISSASSTVDLAQTRVGSVLVSAAVIDDVVGLVMARFVNLENSSPLSSFPIFRGAHAFGGA